MGHPPLYIYTHGVTNHTTDVNIKLLPSPHYDYEFDKIQISTILSLYNLSHYKSTVQYSKSSINQ